MFKKGQKVHYIVNWNEVGDMVVYPLEVYSCGKKQMVLVDREGKKFKGSHFRPQVEQYGCGVVVEGLADSQAIDKAFEVGKVYKAKQIANFERILKDVAPKFTDGYARAIRRDLNAVVANENFQVHVKF